MEDDDMQFVYSNQSTTHLAVYTSPTCGFTEGTTAIYCIQSTLSLSLYVCMCECVLTCHWLHPWISSYRLLSDQASSSISSLNQAAIAKRPLCISQQVASLVHALCGPPHTGRSHRRPTTTATTRPSMQPPSCPS